MNDDVEPTTLASTATGPLPLAGITVVDLTQVIAGPFGTMTLGDLGAEVVKIEAVGRGDRARRFPPYPAYFDTINRNKRSIELDLKSEAGQRVAHDLLAEADVFIESAKPGRVEQYGLDYETVCGLNPNIIYCSISGFGSDSPYESLPAWDMLVQAMSGIMSITGEPDGPPLWSGLPSGDLIAGMYAVQSVLAALYARERGQIDGEWIEVPMLDAAISWLSARAGYTFGTGEPFPRSGTHHPSICPFGVFDCADGRIVIAAGTDSLWADLCTVLGIEELRDDERFATTEARLANDEALIDQVNAILGERTVEEWIPALHAHEVPAGPIYDTATVWEDEHVRQRGLRQTIPREGRPDAEVIAHPVHFRQLVASLRHAPEELGQSTDSVLSELGYSSEEVERLREQGVVGS